MREGKLSAAKAYPVSAESPAVMDMLKVALMASLMLGVEPSESGAWSHLSIDLILNVVFGVLDFAQHMQIFGEGGFG
jgi:hypothetical protein